MMPKLRATPQPQLWTFSLGSSWDDTHRTHASKKLYSTRQEAVQGLWEMIVNKQYYAPGVMTLWSQIFEHLETDEREVYDPYHPTYNAYNAYHQLIRKLIPVDMYNAIVNCTGRTTDELDNQYEPHLLSLQMSEQELTMFMKNYSESACCSSILCNWEIVQVQLPANASSPRAKINKASRTISKKSKGAKAE